MTELETKQLQQMSEAFRRWGQELFAAHVVGSPTASAGLNALAERCADELDEFVKQKGTE